jgi:hypothetical protein
MSEKRKTAFIAICMVWVQTLVLVGMPTLSWSASLDNPGSGYNPLGGPPYPMSPDSYFTDDYGNILMYVNLIGKIGRPGPLVVRENADFGTILTLCGGVAEDANIKKVLLIRAHPDDNGKQVYIVNLKPFMKKGDRSTFVAIKPNDTIIVPPKGFSLFQLARWAGALYPFYNLYDILTPNN